MDSSRQLVFAPGAQAFFRLELRHAEQVTEHLQPVTFRQLDQFCNGLRDPGYRSSSDSSARVRTPLNPGSLCHAAFYPPDCPEGSAI